MKKPEAVKILFVKSKEKLTFDAFRKLYDVKYDELGSNNRAAEEDTIFCFEKFLMDSEGKLRYFVVVGSTAFETIFQPV